MALDGLALEMLPARHGDAILLEWPDGSSTTRPVRRMLVDAGPARAYDDIVARLADLESRQFDRLVLTHVDADHIEGMILAVNDAALALTVDQVWFNGYAQLSDDLDASHGEVLSTLITRRKLPWNSDFYGRAARATEPGTPLRRIDLPGGMVVTVLGPRQTDLTDLQNQWRKVCEAADVPAGSVDGWLGYLHEKRRRLNPKLAYLDDDGQAPTRAIDVDDLVRDALGDRDTKVANRSSLVLLIEYRDLRILLAGDATPSALEAALARIVAERGVEALELTDFKLPHHGSAKNVTREILELAPSARYLFSSDGSHFGHPDDAAVAAVIRYGRKDAELAFNYRNPRTGRWKELLNRGLAWGYSTRYPIEGSSGLRLESGA